MKKPDKSFFDFLKRRNWFWIFINLII
jgi:hypothetical protein